MAALLGSRLNGRPLSDGDAPDGFAAENGRANTPHLRGKSFGRTAGNAVLQRQCNIGLSLRVSVLIVPMASCPCPHVISPWFLCVPSPLTSLITPLVVPLPPRHRSWAHPGHLEPCWLTGRSACFRFIRRDGTPLHRLQLCTTCPTHSEADALDRTSSDSHELLLWLRTSLWAAASLICSALRARLLVSVH